MTPAGTTTTLTEVVPNVPFTGNYTCSVKVAATVTNTCGTVTMNDEKSSTVTCTPPGDGGPQITPPTDGGSGPTCQDCSSVEVKLDYTDPGKPNPTLTPPSQFKDDLKIGRLTIEFKGTCGSTMSCDDIKKIEFRAYDNDSCSGEPNISPIPLNTEDEDSLFGRYGSSIKCSDALIKAGAAYDEGARFRLHQANGDQCRCYKVNVDFKDDPDNRPVCPNMPKESICCAACNPADKPEIIDNPDDPNDGCPGDPDGARANDKPTCYMESMNSCPTLNSKARFKTHSDNGGTIGFDDDFKAPTDDMQPVGQGDEDHDYIYNDRGSYDIKLTCNEDLLCLDGKCKKQTCTKRIRVSCGNPPGNPPPGSPPGGGGGGTTPIPLDTPPIACVVPDISGSCEDQPIQ